VARDPDADPEGSGHVAGAGENLVVSKDNMADLKDKLEDAMKKMPNIEKLKNQVEITVTNEGLRIELLESAKGTFFESGSSKISPDGEDLLATMGKQLGSLPNNLAIEGHTDSKAYSEGRNYGNWELSADRANTARRVLQQTGIRPDQVTQVRGFADQMLRNKENPLDPSNRRVSVIVRYQDKTPGDPADAKGEGEKAKGETKEEKGANPHANESEKKHE